MATKALRIRGDGRTADDGAYFGGRMRPENLAAEPYRRSAVTTAVDKWPEVAPENWTGS